MQNKSIQSTVGKTTHNAPVQLLYGVFYFVWTIYIWVHMALFTAWTLTDGLAIRPYGLAIRPDGLAIHSDGLLIHLDRLLIRPDGL